MTAKMRRYFRRFNWQGFLMAMAGVIFLAVFAYTPMFGIIIGFKKMDYALNIMKSLKTSDWVGLENFIKFFEDRQFVSVITNTLGINFMKLFLLFPVPIIFALLLNEVRSRAFARVVQTITCFPHFISWAIFGGLVISFLSGDGGAFNDLLVTFGILKKPINFMTRPEYFWWITYFSDIVKGIGWGSIIYLAAIAGVDPQLYESALLDGANRGQMAWYITIPSIAGTVTVMLILRLSGMLGNNFDEYYILQNAMNISTSEVLSTFTYKIGVSQRRYSYTTAVGLFSSLVGMIMLTSGNLLSKRLTGRGLY